jgi:DNA-binding NarL/FixJ family response regulator
MSALVGRERELVAARGAIDGAPGRLAAVVLTGEGGIGKSRLLAELVAGVEARGWQVLAGRADALERQIPYAALVRTLDPIGRDADPEIAELGAEVRSSLDVLSGVSRADVDSSFGQACGQVTRLLRALLERGPVAVVLDDLHAMDDDTLALLAIVLRRVAASHIALLATSRPGPAPALLVERLTEDATVALVALDPLDAASIAQLVTPTLGAAAAPALVREVASRAEGNPFFALEIAASAAASAGAVLGTRGSAILQRFVPLDPDARSVLRAIAVLGRVRVGELALVAAVTGGSEEAVAASFDDLVRAELLHPIDGAYGFTHELVREAVYEDIGPAERRRMHRAAATELRAARAEGRPVDVLALARHLSEAADAGDPDAAAVLGEAADRTRAIAPGSAAALYARALELTPAPGPLRASLLAHRCRALTLAGDAVGAVAVGREALGLIGPDSPERARTAIAVIASLFEQAQVDEALAVADAEVALGSVDPVVRSQRPMLLWFSGRLDEAHEEWRRVRALPVDDGPARILVLGQLAMGAATFYEQRALVDIGEELAARAAGAPPTLRLYALAMAAYTQATAGFPDRALPLVELSEAMLDDAGGTPFRGNILVARVMVDWLQGRWDEALDGAAASAAELEGAQLAVHVGVFHAVEIDIRANRGEPVAQPVLDHVPPTRNHVDLKALVVAGLRESLGDHDGARQLIEDTVAASGPATAYLPILLGRLVEIELAAGRRDAACAALERLEESVIGMDDAWSGTCVRRCRATVLGDAGAAHDAVTIADGAGLAFERALAQLAVGALDPTECDELAAAYRTFQTLGADAHRRRAGALLSERGGKIPRQRVAREGILTNAEMAIARLVQQGMRNKEIATFLHYSPRTVEVYLSRIYAKLSVSSRLELARALDARGL